MNIEHVRDIREKRIEYSKQWRLRKTTKKAKKAPSVKTVGKKLLAARLREHGMKEEEIQKILKSTRPAK